MHKKVPRVWANIMSIKIQKSRIRQSTIVVLLICLMAACGGVKEKTITVSDVSISGEAKDYIKVVDGDYILKPVNAKAVIAVKFELVNKYDGSKGDQLGNINLIPLDNSGVAVPDIGLDFKPATVGDWNKFKDLLKGEVGETVIVSFEWNYWSKTEIQKRILKETKGFEIVSADFTGTPSKSSGYSSFEDEDDELNVSNGGSEDWDAILKSYEAFIDKYIALLKKAQKGDMSAMGEYVEYMEKAANLAEQLGNANGDLTPSQVAKFTKLQAKFANAAATL